MGKTESTEIKDSNNKTLFFPARKREETWRSSTIPEFLDAETKAQGGDVIARGHTAWQDRSRPDLHLRCSALLLPSPEVRLHLCGLRLYSGSSAVSGWLYSLPL